MNLNQIANGVIVAVSENVLLSIQVSTGHTVQADFTPVPTFSSAVQIYGQVQPLSGGDIQQMDSLNIGGTRKAIYINGFVDGVFIAAC